MKYCVKLTTVDTKLWPLSESKEQLCEPYMQKAFSYVTGAVPSEENILWNELQLVPDSNLSMIWKNFCLVHIVNILLHYTLCTVQ